MRAIARVAALVAGLAAFAQPASAQREGAAVWKAVQARCNATAAKPAGETGQRIARIAIEEFNRFGGHWIDSDGRMVRFGLTEAEHHHDGADTPQARSDRLGWWQVMKYWYALFGQDAGEKLEVRGYRDASRSTEEAQATALVRTTAARLLRLAEMVSDPAEREILREAALRAAVVDTSWSAAFVSYVIQQSGAPANAFRFANAHSVYIYDAVATSLAEQGGGTEAAAANKRLYRACPIHATRPRIGDLVCHQREPALADAGDEAVRERIRADLMTGSPTRAVRRTHCEVVVHIDVPARKMYTIGGNVNQAVAARKLNLRRDLKFSAVQSARCGGHWSLPHAAPPPAHPCSLNDRKWFVLLQLR